MELDARFKGTSVIISSVTPLHSQTLTAPPIANTPWVEEEGVGAGLVLGVRGMEVSVASGRRGYIELSLPLLQSIPGMNYLGVSFGLATHDVDLDHELGSYPYGCAWLLSGGRAGCLSSRLPGIVFRSWPGSPTAVYHPALAYKDGDRIGILVDCVQTPMLRFFVNGVDVHHIVMSKEIWGKVLYPAFVLNDSVFDIASNPALPGR